MHRLHIKPVIATLLLAICVFRVEGLPLASKSSPTTRSKLAQALSDVTSEYLFQSLALTRGTFQGVSDTFRRLIFAQLQGTINYETAIVFLQNLEAEVVLPTTAKAMQAISHILMKMKQQQDENIAVDVENLLLEALEHYCGYNKEESRQTWGHLVPEIYHAANNDIRAPKKIVDFIGSQYRDFKILKNLRPKNQLDILQKAAEGTSTYGAYLQLTVDADKKVDKEE